MATIGRIRRKAFGEILVAEGLISKEQLEEALEMQRTSGDFLGSILLEHGQITETDILRTLSTQYQLPFLRPTQYDLDRKLIAKFRPEFLHLHKILPLDQIGKLLLIVVTDIPSDDVLNQIQEVAQSNLAIYIGTISDVDQVLREAAPLGESGQAVVRSHRRGEQAPTRKDRQSESGDASEIQKEAVYTLDTSWESIFDEAEGKVKGDG